MSDSDSRISDLDRKVAYLDGRCGVLNALVERLRDEVDMLKRGQTSWVRAAGARGTVTAAVTPWAVGVDPNGAVKGFGISADEKGEG